MASSPPATRSLPGGAIALTGLGGCMLLLCIVLAFLASSRVHSDCAPPEPPPPANDEVFTAETEIQLGGRLCVGLDPSGVFPEERAAQAAEIQVAGENLAAAREAQKAAEAKRNSATGEARVTAQRELEAATTKTKEVEKKLADATAANQPSRRREVLLLIDEIKAPTKTREIDIGAPGKTDRVWVDFSLRGSEDASTEDAKTWRQILGGFTSTGKRPVKLALATLEGAEQKVRVRAQLPGLQLRVYRPVNFYVGALGLLFLAAGVGWLGWNGGLLRDAGPGKQFSLGRVQMAWWLVLVIGGFLFIWLATEQWRGVVTSGVITLLGISAGTGVTARLVDDDATAEVSTGSFWRDILEDPKGLALHRVQLVVWTAILGAIFIWTVFSKLSFPDFDTNLLLLVGIAGGTYVGFKFRE